MKEIAMRPILVLILLLPLPIAAAAEPDCQNWMESHFWEESTASDVRKCLDEGADITVRDGSGTTLMRGTKKATPRYIPL